MLSKDIQAFYLRRPDVQGTDKLLRCLPCSKT